MRTILLSAAVLALSACASDDAPATTTLETPSGATVTQSPDGVVTTDGPNSPGASTAGTMMADEADDAIERAWEADADLARFDLDASDENGGVYLTGTVDTNEQRDAAGALATQTAPGVRIDNRITVRR